MVGANTTVTAIEDYNFEVTTWSPLITLRKNEFARFQTLMSGKPEENYNSDMVGLLLRLKSSPPVATFKSTSEVLKWLKPSRK